MRHAALTRQRPVLQRAFAPRTPSTSQLVRSITNSALRYVGEQAAGALKRKFTPSTSNSSTQTGKRYKSLTNNYRVRTLGHGKEKVRTSKKKVINRDLPKKMKKFQKKVLKVVNHTKNFGEYTYYSQKQLRQTDVDKWAFFTDDYNGRAIVLGSNRALVDAASICFNAKPMGNDYTNLVTNFGPTQNIELISETLDFFFKSTSSHVVNIEMYEFTAKVDTDTSPLFQMNLSADDYTNRWAASNSAVESTFWFDNIGAEIRHFPTLYQTWRVKCHKFKLPPGHTTSKSFKRGARTYEALKHLNSANNAALYNKGVSVFYFRVINDITVSTSAAAPAIVHHWNSNVQGGVACMYKRIIRTSAPNQATVSDKPTIAVGFWNPVKGAELDQQVCVENPIATTTIG